MKVEMQRVAELIENGEAPLPLEAIPNLMGINLTNVIGMSWTCQDDGQLVNLTIHFLPEKDK